MRCRWSANTVHNGFAGMYFTFPPPVPPLVEFLLPWGFVFITYRVCLWGSRADSSCGWPYFLVPYTETFSWIQEESSDTVPAFPVASVSTYSNALLFSCMEPVPYTFPVCMGRNSRDAIRKAMCSQALTLQILWWVWGKHASSVHTLRKVMCHSRHLPHHLLIPEQVLGRRKTGTVSSETVILAS